MAITFRTYAAVSLGLLIAVVANAYMHEPQFYLACVYVIKSNASVMVLYNAALMGVIVVVKMLQRVFLGTLRATEVEVRRRRAGVRAHRPR